ncbi:MAG: chemotaxis protein MotB [Bacteroidota bacterium]|nr:chemotaxis protein MotB [Bacteroidota bacterium]
MFKIIIIAMFSAVLLTSCYTAGTYNAMMANRDSLKLAGDSLQRILENRNMTISDQKLSISDFQKRTAQFEHDIDSLKALLRSIKDNYEELKANSSNETKELLDKIEIIQTELAAKEQKIKEINNALKTRENAINSLKTKLNNALLGFADKGISISIKNGKVYVSLSNQLLFKLGSTEIDKKGKEALLELAKELNNNLDINILIEGHTDISKVIPNARFQDNWDLSVLRATEVVRFLTAQGGVDPTRIVASGRGEFFPVEQGDTPEIRAMNRRTEIILTPKLEELFQMIKE